jgi:hypothetical protein
MDVGGSSPHNAEGQQQSLVSPVYPPAADEAIEERKVSEVGHLRIFPHGDNGKRLH